MAWGRIATQLLRQLPNMALGGNTLKQHLEKAYHLYFEGP